MISGGEIEETRRRCSIAMMESEDGRKRFRGVEGEKWWRIKTQTSARVVGSSEASRELSPPRRSANERARFRW